MCGFKRDTSESVKAEDIIAQIEHAVNNAEKFEMVKIFTSGSFFDSREVPEWVRKQIYGIFSGNIKRLTVESRPEFIRDEILNEIQDDFEVEVAFGLESASDTVRDININKGFSFSDYIRAVETVRNYGFRVKTYLLLKPPLLTEGKALKDVIESARIIKDVTDTISLNICNVQKDTVLEKLWYDGLYRPPWLWTAIEALITISNMDIHVISDPVGGGKRRGPHNCFKCDGEVIKAIREFSLLQDINILEDVRNTCHCYFLWEKVLDLEDIAGVPLVE
jgi:hypothetical protein